RHPLEHAAPPPARVGHDVVELLDPPVDGIGTLLHRRQLLVVRGKEGEVLADDLEALLVVGHFEVGDTGDLRVAGGAAPLLPGDVLPAPPPARPPPPAPPARGRPPPSAIDDVPFTIGTKSASAGMYAVPAAQWPS